MNVRSAKSKGNQFEYSVYDSLKPKYPDIRLTKQLGFVSQYDLISDGGKFVIECKRHKNFSWNALKKFLYKLQDNTPAGYRSYLILQANHQPVLLMLEDDGTFVVREFENFFETPFIKHIGVKKSGAV